MSTRFIIVQTSACTLFGAFTCEPSQVSLNAPAALDDSVHQDMLSNAEDGSILELDKSFYASDVRDELAVYQVPSDFPAYDEDEVSGDDAGRGKLFEGFRDFDLVGVIVVSKLEGLAA